MLATIHISTVLGFIFIVLYALSIIDLVVMVLLENRNPLKTISWVLVLIFVPGIGLIFYYFFGRDNRKLRIISRRTYRKLLESFSPNENTTIENSNIPDIYLPLTRLLNNSNYSAIFHNSKIEFFTNGQDKFNSLLEDIENAKHHIHLQYYIFEDDEIGNIVKKALLRKAHEGVKIRVLYDDVGSWDVKRRFYNEMQDNGIETYPFLKVFFPLLASKVNYRNHRKIVVIDGKTGYMGGMNIADRYFKGNKLGQWRDTHFRLTGEAVHGLQSAFLTDWCAVSNEIITGDEYYPKSEILHTDMDVQIVTSGPSREWRTLLQSYIFCIANAKKYIYIQTPYFLPTEGLNQALQMAALSGIDVRIMIPKHSDTRTAQLATLSYVEKMLNAGVKIYLYNKGFLHSKMLLIDDAVTSIGSANFDFRSFEHNFEINAFVYQKNFAITMRKMFENDINDCEQITLSRWKNRPLPERLSESFMRLFAPLL